MRASLLILIFAAAIAGCGPTRLQQLQQNDDATGPEAYGREKALYEGNVGKDYWLNGVVRLCQVPSSISLKSVPLAGAPLSDGHLKIDGIERGIIETAAGNMSDSAPYYHVVLNDGRTGYIMSSELMAYGTDIDPVKAAADCKRRGNPRIGMTSKQVEATCWGKPDHVNRTETGGVISDQYVYGDNRYVYLRNGIVTSIQTSGTLR